MLRGAGQAAPLGSPGRRNQDDKPTQIIINAAEVPQHGLTGRPSSNSATALHAGSLVERELDLPGCRAVESLLDHHFVIPAQAGIQWVVSGSELGPRLRGDDVEWVGNAEF